MTGSADFYSAVQCAVSHLAALLCETISVLVASAACSTLLSRSESRSLLRNSSAPEGSMLHRSDSNLIKVLLIIFGLWTTSCSSYPSLQGNGTAIPTGFVGHNRPVNGEAQDSKEVVPTGFSTSYNLSTSSQPSPLQTGCSYVLGYATFWPGPSVITRTDSTICPSLASTTVSLITDKHELIVCSI
jgi:hypothetical protein